MGINLRDSIQEKKDVILSHDDMMKSFLLKVGYNDSAEAKKLIDKIPGKKERRILEDSFRKRREEQMLRQRMELHQKYHVADVRRDKAQTRKRVLEL